MRFRNKQALARLRQPQGKKEAARDRAAFYVSFNFDPTALAPISVAFVLAPPVMIPIRPLPVIAIDAQLQFGFIIRPAANVPAVTVVIAYDGG
jgi:hypothetical protein